MGGKESLPAPPGVWWIPFPVSLTDKFWGRRRPVSQPSKTFFRENGREGVLEEVADGSTAAEELLYGETVVATICRMVTESGQLVCQVVLDPVFAENKDIQAHLQNCGGSKIT
jgi:hypothetical protein